jgi:S1-C subfamily serine protease
MFSVTQRAARLLLLFGIFSLLGRCALGQDCTRIASDYRLAVVSITVDKEIRETAEAKVSHGTGFIITPNGYVLTAYHVVAADPAIYKVNWIKGAIGSLRGEGRELEVVDKIAERDVALLKFSDDSRPFTPVPLGSPWNTPVGRGLCGLSFSNPLNLDYHPSPGALSQRNGPNNLWVTNMPSNAGESGGPVFDATTSKVVAMKFGTINRASVPVTPDGVNYLTPINLARTLVEDYTSIRLPSGDPQQSAPPALLCIDSQSDPRNQVEMRLDVDCNGCTHRTETKKSWESSPFRTRTEWNTTQSGWLSASAEASVELKCQRSVGDYVLGLTARHSSMAGWGGTSGDYRYSSSAVTGSASTGFPVEGGDYCLAVTQYDQGGERKKGYPGSAYFSEGPVRLSLIVLESPNGREISLKPGISIPLDDRGFWRFRVAVDSSHRSGWAEDSGSITISNLLRFKFTPRAAGGECPAQGGSPANNR